MYRTRPLQVMTEVLDKHKHTQITRTQQAGEQAGEQASKRAHRPPKKHTITQTQQASKQASKQASRQASRQAHPLEVVAELLQPADGHEEDGGLGGVVGREVGAVPVAAVARADVHLLWKGGVVVVEPGTTFFYILWG